MRIRCTPKLIAAAAFLAIAPQALAGATQPEPDERTQRAIRAAEDISLAFSYAAEAVRPSVVGVTSVRRVEMRRGRPGPQMPGDPFFDRFFEDFFDRFAPPGQRDMPQGDRPGQPQPDDRYFERRGGGSGFIVSEEGHILTNNHVIQDASEITVRLNDGTTRSATLVGADPQSDLAVIKIDTEGLSALVPARFADSDAIRVGQWVVAAGDPFGLTSTITAGVISATGRSRIGLIDYEDFIQTDAAINPGNSGGPLVNLRGEVVGVNTAIASRTGGFMGIGFAIPSNMAEMVMRELIDQGVVTRGWLGVSLQDLTPELARTFGFEGKGTLIGDVLDDGPAQQAGLQSGDIIVRFDGREIETMEDLRTRVARTAPGTAVPVEVFRDGETVTISVELGTRETEQVAAAPRQATEPQIDRELGFSLRAAQSGQGVTVTGVEPGSPAQRQGFAAGDTILRVGDTEVNSPADFRRALREHRELGSARLLVSRGNMRSFRLLSFD
ncbi:MAG: Do family serine endopeptidase [Phycisphaerales bacterium]|nr:Do family serine endopeptidase [Phycisphaerales bacterium]